MHAYGSDEVSPTEPYPTPRSPFHLSEYYPSPPNPDCKISVNTESRVPSASTLYSDARGNLTEPHPTCSHPDMAMSSEASSA